MSFTASELEQGIEAGITDILSRYSNAGDMNTEIFGDLSGLDIDIDTANFLQTITASNTTWWEQMNSADPSSYVASTLKSIAFDWTQTGLQAANDLNYTRLETIKATIFGPQTVLVTTIEELDGLPTRAYIDKNINKFITSSTVYSEITHIPYGQYLASIGKAVGNFAVFESMRSTVTAAYNVQTGQEENLLAPLKNYLIASATAIATAMVAVLAGPGIAASAIAASVGGVIGWTVHSALNALPAAIEEAKLLGKTLAETYDVVKAIITEKIVSAWDATGELAEEVLDKASEYVNDLYNGAAEFASDLGFVYRELSDHVSDILGGFFNAETQPTPLVMDIDGGGVQLVSKESANAVYYDLNGDGFGTSTGWTAGGDGFLAIDLNEDGVINNGTELFGDQTGYANGFEALAVYDSNGDGLITSGDDDWANFLVWIDANGNGFSETSELYSLDDLNITSINLAYTQTDYVIAGNSIYQQSTFTMNGASRTVVDAYFSIDTTNTTYVGNYTLDPAVTFLPVMRGYGQLPDLHIAASLDNDQQDSGSLLSLLIDFADMDMSDIFAADAMAMDAVKEVLFRWAGVESISPTTRGLHVDARELAFLEALAGEAFIQIDRYTDPNAAAGRDLTEAFRLAQNHYFATLVAQTEAGALLTGDLQYNILVDSFEGLTGIDTDVLDTLETEATVLTSTAERQVFWQNVVRLVEYTIGTANLSTADHDALDDAIIASDISLSLSSILTDLVDIDWLNVIDGTSGNDTLDGTAGADKISGAMGDDVLSGFAGADELYGGDGADTLIGGTGDDLLNGGSGNDVYIYQLGDGTDIVTEVGGGGADKILFGPGITLNDLTFTRVSNDDLEVAIDTGTQTGRIFIAGQFTHSAHVVETIQFDDSSTLDLTVLDHALQGYAQGSTLYGVEVGGGSNDTLIAGAGGDVMFARGGNDTLVAGAGLDQMYGEAGDDTYVFGLGDAQVFGTAASTASYSRVTEQYSAGTDTLHITDAVDPDDVRAWTGQYGELYVQYSATDIIFIEGGLNGYGESLVGQKLEKIVFDDSTEWDLTQGLRLHNNDTARTISGSAYGDVIQAGAGGDNLYGRAGADTLIAGSGKDNLYGGTESDTYVFGLGDAQVSGTGLYTTDYSSVVEYDSQGTDTLHITDGVDADDVRLWTGQYGDLFVQYSATDVVYIQGGMNGYGESLVGQKLEKIVFDDATEWDLTQGLHLRNNDTARTIYGTTYDDVIQAGAGGDNLYGRTGADTLIAGAGKDNLYGGAGSDTYVFGLGDAQVSGSGLYTTDYSSVVEYASEGTDTLHITDAVDPDDVRMWTGQYGDLFVQYSATDIIYIQGGMNGYGESLVGQKLEKIVFDDATEWDLTQGLHLRNNDTARTIYGTTYDDVIQAGAGGDNLYGRTGADTLIAGAGKDNLYGGVGADTYVFGLGDAQVSGSGLYTTDYSSIVEYASEGTDTLHITDAVDPDDVRMWTEQYGGLYVQYSATDIIYIQGGMSGYGGSLVGERLEKIVFDDTTEWDLTQGLHLRNNDTARNLYGSTQNDVIEGGAGGDALYGYGGDDILMGRGGSDNLFGGAGADTFVFLADDVGDGIDTLNDFNVTDGDKIDLRDVLDAGYDPITDALADFVQFTNSGSNSTLSVDMDGAGTTYGWTQIATIYNHTNLDPDAMVTAGQLLAA